jgi:acylphosphatase
MMKAIFIKVTGDVQGVNFRYFAQKKAKELSLAGWAKNEHDGSVTIFAQGTEASLRQLVAWSAEGSPMATVAGVIANETEVDKNIKGFEVK